MSSLLYAIVVRSIVSVAQTQTVTVIGYVRSTVGRVEEREMLEHGFLFPGSISPSPLTKCRLTLWYCNLGRTDQKWPCAARTLRYVLKYPLT